MSLRISPTVRPSSHVRDSHLADLRRTQARANVAARLLRLGASVAVAGASVWVVVGPALYERRVVHEAAPLVLLWAAAMFAIASAVAATYREGEQVIRRIFHPTFQMAAVLALRAERGRRFRHSDLEGALRRITTRDLAEERVVTHHALAEAADLAIEHLDRLGAIVVMPLGEISEVGDPWYEFVDPIPGDTDES